MLFAPCGFNSLNKLAHGIADNLALSVVAEAIGRRTPVIVGPSLNQPLLDHPMAQASLKTLRAWHVTVVPPVDEGEGPRLAPTAKLLDAVSQYIRRGYVNPRSLARTHADIVVARSVATKQSPSSVFTSSEIASSLDFPRDDDAGMSRTSKIVVI